MPEITVEIESVGGLAVNEEALLAFDESLRTDSCVLGPSVSMNTAEGTIGVTMTIVAPSHQMALERAVEAMDRAGHASGLIQAAEPARTSTESVRTCEAVPA